MANSRLHYNDLRATLSGTHTSGATTLNFTATLTHANGTNVPTLANGDWFTLSVLDASGNLVEIVKATAYTAAATSATVVRAQEGTPATAFTAGQKVVGAATAASLPSFIGCAAERTSAQSISNAVWTAIQLTAEVYDTSAIHDTASNTSRFTVPSGMGGVWRFNATTQLDGGGTGIRAYAWKKNGTQLTDRFGGCYRTASPVYATVETVSVELSLAAGDYIEHLVYHENGSAMNVNSAYITCQYLGTV